MRDFQNAFDAALAGVDSTIVEVMGSVHSSPRGHSVAEKFRGFLTIRSRWDLPVAGSVLKEAARHYLCGRIRFVLCGVVTR
ncbi:Tail attachment protein (Minor capsid protein FII) [Escherichia coli]|nr:phage head-tail joining protein [Escherichia coli UMEA 3292-1]CTW93366.1 Tail attachment protein (Minor capsid protein FII) [Escherichia coli]